MIMVEYDDITFVTVTIILFQARDFSKITIKVEFLSHRVHSFL